MKGMKRLLAENLFDLLLALGGLFTFWVGYICGYDRHSRIANEADAKLGREVRESYERQNQRIVEEMKWK